MKKTILFIALFAITNYSFGQNCCSKNSTTEFATLASSESFAAAHAEPLPFKDEKPLGSNVTFPTNGSEGRAYLRKAKTETNNWIFIFHEWWGLNDYIRKEADKIYSDAGNCNVLAIDLYDGKVAETTKDAQSLVSNLSEDRVMSLIAGAKAFTGGGARIVNLGWCMGGGWALQAAIAEKDAAGCVIYYGMPENNEEKLKRLECDILGFFADKDEHITPKAVKDFEEHLKAAGIKYQFKSYNAVHAFANPSNPKHDPVASKDAYDLSIKYIKEKFAAN